MNRIAILCCGDLSRAQYIYKYLKFFDENGYKYDLIYWNRSNEDNRDKCEGSLIEFNKIIDSYLPFYKKIFSYIEFASFVNNQIKNHDYKAIICLTSPMAVCVVKNLLCKYKKRYLFDFRDLTKEYFSLYKKLVQSIAYNSGLFVASSPGYLDWFDMKHIGEFCLCHNTFSKVSFKKNFYKNEKEPIRIAYWGAIRQIEYNKKVCDYFGNREEIEFIYHGEGGGAELDAYCREKNYNNIRFTGKYYLNEISRFAAETDIVFCAYDIDFVTSPAMAVKVYDSIEYQLPIIVTKGSFMEKYLEGISHMMPIDIKETKLEDIILWYKEIDENLAKNDFVILKNTINSDEDVFYSKLRSFLEKMNCD